MKYEVNLNIFANTTIEIEAENLEDAKSKAANQLIDIDLNTLAQEVTVNFIQDATGEVWTETHAREWIRFRNIFLNSKSVFIYFTIEVNNSIKMFLTYESK